MLCHLTKWDYKKGNIRGKVDEADEMAVEGKDVTTVGVNKTVEDSAV